MPKTAAAAHAPATTTEVAITIVVVHTRTTRRSSVRPGVIPSVFASSVTTPIMHLGPPDERQTGRGLTQPEGAGVQPPPTRFLISSEIEFGTSAYLSNCMVNVARP